MKNFFSPRFLIACAAAFAASLTFAQSTNLGGLVALRPGDQCTSDPKFLASFGASKKALVDTSSTKFMGMSLIDLGKTGQYTEVAQHPSWKLAGYLGRVQRDRDGHIYVYPVPVVSVKENPVEKANTLWRVDSHTGIMAEFAQIPKLHAPTANNPFGIIATALDCEHNALYVSTVMGSTIDKENGAIFRVSLKDASVNLVKTGIDALSLSIVLHPTAGKRLFVGATRDNAVISFGVNADGKLSETSNLEINLDDVSMAQDKRPRVLRVDRQGMLAVRSTPFDYTLVARTSIPISEIVFGAQADGKGFRKLSERVTATGVQEATRQSSPEVK